MKPSNHILLVFPHNFCECRNGVQKRIAELVQYLNRRRFTVDLLALKNFQSRWNVSVQTKRLPGIRNLYFYDHSKGLKIKFIHNLLRFRFKANKNLLGQEISHLPNYAFTGLRKLFNRIIRRNDYDFILISYVQWASLIKGNETLPGKTILTMEDCLSWNLAGNHPDKVPLNQLLSEESELVNLFDQVVCLSWEEMEYFSKHTDKPKFHYVPVFMDRGKSMPGISKEFDILFIGSGNESNQRGIKWFFDFVYPILHKELKILIVGKIAETVSEYQNVSKIDFVEDLQDVYQKSGISIIPLQDGTGMKVKVIESLAYGIPVVSTTYGLSGMKPEVKRHFITADQPEAFASAIHRLISDKSLYLEYAKLLNDVFNEHFITEVGARSLDKVFEIHRDESENPG